VAYLDSTAGRPLSEAALIAYERAAQEAFSEPTQLHREGRRARLLLDTARTSLAQSLDVPRDRLAVHPSRAAATRFALDGAFRGSATGTPASIVVGSVEHSEVLHTADELAGRDTAAVRCPVDAAGRIDVDGLANLLASVPPGAVVAVQSANQEVGTRQPLAAVQKLCTDAGAVLVVDCSTTAAWETLPSEGDVVIADASQWGGPRSVAVTVVRPGARFRPSLFTRPQIPDVPAVVAGATALEECRTDTDSGSRVRALVDRIRAEVPRTVPDVEVVGDPLDRAPHVVTFSCLYVAGEALVTALDALEYSVGSGSACTADTLEPSHVLAAMGALTHGNVRVGLSPSTSEAEVEGFLNALPDVVQRLRRSAGMAP
jgi:cysteine desulfurase